MDRSHASSTPNRLNVGTKLAYGAGDPGVAIVASVNGFFLNAFLLDVAGLGAAPPLAVVWRCSFWHRLLPALARS